MTIKIIIFLLSLIAITVLPLFKPVKNNRKVTPTGYVVIFSSLLLAIISCISIYADEKSSEDQKNRILSLSADSDNQKNTILSLRTDVGKILAELKSRGMKYDSITGKIVNIYGAHIEHNGFHFDNSPGAVLQGNTNESHVIYEVQKKP